MTDSDGIQHTEIDGVRTLWAECDGPLRACLTFRVGMADDSYLTAGQSHVVEHLALFGIADPARHNNGHVDQTTTAFHTHGRPADIVDFLDRVTAQLRRLPVERLELERSVLAAEDASNGASVARLMSAWRFGAQGYGLAGVSRWGERLLGPESLQAWADQRFTRENAVLWLSGRPPADLRLNLPTGRHFPTPEPVSILPREPSWFREQTGGLAISALLPRGAATVLMLGVLDELMRERLRVAQAISYSPAISVDRLTGRFSHVVAFADAAAERRGELPRHVGDLVAGLQALPPERIVEIRQNMLRLMDEADAHSPDDVRLAEVASTAVNQLTGGPVNTREEWRAELAEVTVGQYYDAATALMTGALYAVPPDAHVPPLLGEPTPGSLAAPLRAKGRRHRDAPVIDDQLIVTADGVTRRTPHTHLTVRYDRLVGALRTPDGAVTLIGTDATHLTIEPTLWRGGKRLAAQAMAAVPSQLTATLPAREPQDVPKPSTTWFQRNRAAGARAGRHDVRPTLLIGLIVVLVVCGIANIFYGGDWLRPLVFTFLLAVGYELSRRSRTRRTPHPAAKPQ